jgi:hypothetical protein
MFFAATVRMMHHRGRHFCCSPGKRKKVFFIRGAALASASFDAYGFLY